MARTERGQSMLEAIIACGIIVTAVAASLTLVQSAIQASKESETSITAANLAREGVEVVHGMRDGNWLAGMAFNTGMSSGTDYTAIPMFDPVTNVWTLNYGAVNAITDVETAVYRHDGTLAGSTLGLMVQGVTPVAGMQKTVFSRMVTTDPICEDALGAQTVVTSGSLCAVGSTAVGVRVASTVRWNLSGRIKTFTSEERLYDWR